MENKDNARRTTVILQDAEFQSLISLAGVKIGAASPLAGFGASTAPAADAGRLQQLGLLASAEPARLAPDCLKALNILANPDAETTLMWGNPEKVNYSAVFSSRDTGSTTMVAYGREGNGSHHLSYFLSHEDIIDLIKGTTAFSELKDVPDFSLKMNAGTLPVLFGVLDLYQEARLRAALDRRSEFQPDLSAEEITRILTDARMESSLAWYAPVGYLMMPDKVSDAGIREGLETLKRGGVIAISRGLAALSAGLNAFAHRAFPVISYSVVKVSVNRGANIERLQLGFIRGMATLLLLHLPDESGATLQLDSITTSDVPELLFNIITMPFEAPAAPKPAAAPPKINYCPKCGDPVKSGEKFCDKCGKKLE